MSISNFVYNPQGQYLFGRQYSVSIGPPGNVSAFKYTALQIKFDINKLSAGTSGKSKIEIVNLSTQSRQSFNKGYNVLLQAGYKGLIETLFLGQIVNAISVKGNTETTTTMECGDAESAIVFATLDKTYPEGSTLVQIIQDLAKSMGVNAGVARGIPEKVFGTGFTATGSISSSLDKLLRNQNLEWSIQNGNININPINATIGLTAIVVSAETGMIGIPSNNAGFTQFTSLLNPKLIPGALVQLISENTALNGFYKIRRSHFEGDSHANKWQVECEVVPISGAATLPSAQGFNYNTAVIG